MEDKWVQTNKEWGKRANPGRRKTAKRAMRKYNITRDKVTKALKNHEGWRNLPKRVREEKS